MTPLEGLPGGPPYVPLEQRRRRAVDALRGITIGVYAGRAQADRYGLPWPAPADPRGPALAVPELEVRG